MLGYCAMSKRDIDMIQQADTEDQNTFLVNFLETEED